MFSREENELLTRVGPGTPMAVLLDHDDIYVSTYDLFRREALTRERSMALAFIKAHAEAIKDFTTTNLWRRGS